MTQRERQSNGMLTTVGYIDTQRERQSNGMLTTVGYIDTERDRVMVC